MTLPPTWPTVPVFGTYLRVDGTPNEGSVWFETSQRVVVLDENGLTIGVVPRRIIANLDANGHFALDLPCTDAGAQPTGWTWQVYERFNSGQPVYSIEVPQALIGVGINLAQYPHAVPVPVAPPVVSYLTTADIGVTVADQVGVDNAISTANAAATTASAAQAAAANAVTTANDASAVANAIDGKAQSALDNSNAAVTTANAASATATAAQNTANAIDGKAQSALDASAAATTTANDAKTTADGIAGTANTALANANAAVTTANAAQTTADAALPATSNAVSASKWATPRTLSLTGPVTGSAAVDGSADAPIATTITDKSIDLGKIDPTGSTAGQLPQSTGPAAPVQWVAPPAAPNLLINGAGQINQRGYVSGTATTAANQYTVDRWKVLTSGQNLSWATSNGVATFTAPAGGVSQVVEGAAIIGGNYVLSWTGTATATVAGNPVTSGTPFALAANTNTEVKFVGGTFSLPKLERGVLATPFDFRHPQQELALCQRYFTSSYDIGTAVGAPNATTAYSMFFPGPVASYSVVAQVTFPVKMRVSPSVNVYSPKTGAINMAYRTNVGSDISAYVQIVNSTGVVIGLSSTASGTEGIAVAFSANAEL